MNDLTSFERDVMMKHLNGDHPVLATLREQLKVARVADRKVTGVGFYTDFEIPPTVSNISQNVSFEITDVIAQIHGVENGAGFVLYIKDGILDCLECFTYDELLPINNLKYELSYVSEKRQLVFEH